MEGKMADITIFNPNIDYVIDVDKFVSKSKNSPFNGFPVSGKVTTTIVNGKPTQRDGSFVL
jgi:dihydroorotase